jgi:hypothetical protein
VPAAGTRGASTRFPGLSARDNRRGPGALSVFTVRPAVLLSSAAALRACHTKRTCRRGAWRARRGESARRGRAAIGVCMF